MANSSTSNSREILDTALGAVPTTFRKKLVEVYVEIKTRKAKNNHDATGLSVGKFCETTLRLLQEHVTGSHIPFGTRIRNFNAECSRLEQSQKTTSDESLRIVIPRALNFLYTLRNKRGIGHVGGEIEANEIDIVTMARIADWVLCELIRVFHKLPIEEAQALIDSIAIRELPTVWSVAGKKRVLQRGLRYGEQVLLLAYSETESAGILSEDIFKWVEHSNYTLFKRDVLKPLHKKRLIEFDADTETIHISPLGVNEVETNLLHKKA